MFNRVKHSSLFCNRLAPVAHTIFLRQYNIRHHIRVFVFGSHCFPCLMFGGKAGAYPCGALT
jgi:hypothetical protein